MFSIYIHIPFCLKKCGYCDFYSVAMPKIPHERFVAAVCEELRRQIETYDLRGRRVNTIYFGGGTPTTFEPLNLETILNCIYKNFSVADDVEITIEANPETLELLWNSCETPVILTNRLSIGIQSFNDRFLHRLGRIHSAETARRAVRMVQDAGQQNVSVDLMWGLPGQGLADLEADLDEAIGLGVQHISAYQLTPKDSCRGGALPPPNHGSPQRGSPTECRGQKKEDFERKMFFIIHDKLTSVGYEHYEISNFALKNHRTIAPSDHRTIAPSGYRTSFRCRHNENYWHYGEWLGLGPGATSSLARFDPFVGGSNDERRTHIRFTAVKDITRYLAHKFEYDIETIDTKTSMAEYCFLGLRTSDGIDLTDFERRFGQDFGTVYPGLTAEWTGRGLAQDEVDRFSLTTEGFIISDELFQKFI